MPRRRRPAYRLPPKTSGGGSVSERKYQNQLHAGPSDKESKVLEEGPSDDLDEELEYSCAEATAESDTDAPRIAVWEEDDQDLLLEANDEEKRIENEKSLQRNLQDLPLGALRRAQRLLTQAEAETDFGSGTDEPDADDDVLSSKGKGKEKEKVVWSTKLRQDIGRRPNKHAPMELTARKPVSRSRVVVDVAKIVPRDPRFLPTAGVFEPQVFQQSYGFLADRRKTELKTLKESMTKARKWLGSSPSHLKSEREKEVWRLEHAIKRAESMANKDRLDMIEQEALRKGKKEEAEKRKQGKGSWFLKKGEKKELLLKARYEALAREGGQRAVKKAIEKRQKRMSQNEKRLRPRKRERPPGPADSEGRPSKRARAM